MSRPFSFASIIAIFLISTSVWAQSAGSGDDAAVLAKEVQTTWQLLDYIGVDYSGAVADGEVADEMEYAEMQEFAQTVSTRIAALPAHAARAALLEQAAQLQRLIDGKGALEDVASLSHGLASALLAAYPVPLSPRTLPDHAQGAADYAQQCAMCHGAAGGGDGALAANLEIPPIDFTDVERARQRSVFALYQVISQGLDGTPMPSYAQLSEEQRWALAFVTGQFAYDETQAAQGEALWQADARLRALIPDVQTLVGLTPAALSAQIGEDNASAVMAYLRRHPEVLSAPADGTLSVARERLKISVAAIAAGDRKRASDMALSAYLDGFEPYEPALRARDAALVAQIESHMLGYRAALQRGESADVLDGQRQALDDLLGQAEHVLGGRASAVSTFIGAASILLREGLEALLVVIAMIAFLRKAERTEVMGYVHAGWVSALVVGVLTWVVATWVINISGASRELMEGFGSLLAALVLLSVGIWMHGKAQAGQWQRYIREKMSKALSGRTGWFLFGLAFVVVYREVFETILFYAALSAQGNGMALLSGALTASVVLVIVAWLMLRYSRRLPISEFFRYSAWLMAILTVVLAGKGVAALQEAGIFGITPLAGMPTLDWAGVLPTLETMLAQVLAIVLLVLGFMWNRRQSAQ